ncbi:type VI secretion system membrane subunit TssM [Vibrio brasiliensis]|uniref:type VI secretion system membrane subunit TssM n=1 Tax=Vibrio brasiliensis TaxID=170652 RepID=UPI001EFE9D7E|nr:type VI secretion system membrane subunit TssM [Vibrio brasiliensis]MCG9748984.1 type VI secretion system membrane subunit TssM [Vibrio brasiliensis]MCG9783970.1 type VI secretion system membrane subunit TssM [Vibrio brasiliensis]
MTKPTDKNKKRSLIWALTLTLVLWLIGGGLTWWLGYPDYLTLSIVATVFTGLCCGLLCYWLMQRNSQASKTPDQQRLLIQKRSKLLAIHFKRMIEVQKRKKRLNSRYDQPIYLFLSDDPCKDKSIITQMGYEAYKVDDFGNDIEFPVLFWLSEHSIMISVSCGDDQQAQYLKTLTECLNKWRPRQAINGMLLTTEVETLLGNREALIQRADDLKSTIKTFNDSFGLNIPIYNLITNMGQINDFCQFFSAFDEAKRNDVFGATSPYIKNGGIDADWFNEEYDHLISQLIASTSTALSSQLNQDYRNSICAAPYQFGLLKQSLWHFLQRLYRGDQLNNGLCFRGFYFTHSGADTKQYDLLANVINESLGNEKFQQQQQIPVTQTLFAQHIMNHVVLNENTLVGVNRRKENMLLFWQGAYTVFCVALLVTVLAVIKLDFDYQSAREARADNMLERYKEAIAASPYDIENMADNIPNLYSLNRIYALYLEPAPWYTLSFMPSSSIMDEVEAAYFEELSQVLIPSMENTLEKDLFVYVNLEDQAKTLSLLNNYRLLFDPKRTNIEELKSYFMSTLSDQGEADSVNLAQLRILLDDVFAQDLVPVKPNYDLETLAKKVINQTGIETLLYEHILNSPTYSKRIDVRPELGSNFSQLLSFSPSYAGYMVPYLYTPSGFNELDLSVESPVLAEALQAYEGVAGNSPSALELYRISRDLKQMYQNDYINYWRDMTSHIQVNDVNDPDTLNRTLSVLTSASDNPLAQLYTTVSKYTSVEIELPKEQGKETQEQPPAQDSDKKEMARQIYIAFTPYHQQVTANDQGTKPIDALLGQFTEMEAWLEKFLSSETPQEMAFNTLTAELKLSNPVSVVAANTAKQPALSVAIIANITQQANEMVMSLAHSYLNSSWQEEVFDTYQNTIAAYYPFNKSSSLDAATNDVASFFKSNGVLDKFYQSKLKGFSTDERSPFLAGLLPNTGLALDPNVWQMIDKAADIRNALFLQDPQNLSLQFQLKALEMSPDLTQFSIVAEKSLFTYQHGPRLWSKQNWSATDVDKDSIGFQLRAQDVQVADEKFTGSWAWFKLIEPRVISATSQSTRVKFSHKDSQVELSIKTQGQNNPFVPNFFSAFTLPANI